MQDSMVLFLMLDQQSKSQKKTFNDNAEWLTLKSRTFPELSTTLMIFFQIVFVTQQHIN